MIVGGDECEIIDKTDDLVTCVTSGDADLKFQNLFPGSRGVIAEVYEGLEDASGLGESYDDYIGKEICCVASIPVTCDVCILQNSIKHEFESYKRSVSD